MLVCYPYTPANRIDVLILAHTYFIYLAYVDSLHLSSINHTDAHTSLGYDREGSNCINFTVWHCRLHTLLIVRILSNLTHRQMVKDSKDQAYLATKSLTHASQFPKLQSLTRWAYDSEEESDHQEVIKSKSQSDIKEYQNLCIENRDINSTNPRSPIFSPPPINTITSQHRPQRLSLFNNISIFHALTKATEIKLLNKPEDWVDWNRKLQGTFGLAGL